MKGSLNGAKNEMRHSRINCDVLELASISFIPISVNVES